MSRPMVLAFMMILLIITSQLEWRQPILNEPMEVSPSISHKEDALQRKEMVKEKVILQQEKTIRKLNDLLRRLHAELQQCKDKPAYNRTTEVPEIASVLQEEQVAQT